MKGRQDRDGIHEAWLINRSEHANTHDAITLSLYYCCLVCHSYTSLDPWLLSMTSHCYGHGVGYSVARIFLIFKL